MRVWSLCQEDPLEKDTATHSSTHGPQGRKELDMTEATQQARKHGDFIEPNHQE